MSPTQQTDNRSSLDPALNGFQGFQAPTTTPVPDELFDRLLAVLSGAELKVLLYIIRRTFGFKKSYDSIALSQMLNGITTRDGQVLDRGCGVKDKKTILQALRTLEERKMIVRGRQSDEKNGDLPTIYGLNIIAGLTPLGGKSHHGEGGKLPQGLGGKSRQALGGEIPPHNMTDLQQTEQQQPRKPSTKPVQQRAAARSVVVAS